MGKKAILWVIILGLISAGVIFYKFNQIPSHLDLDEAEFARLAISLYKEPLTIFSPYATGHATPYFYLILASFLTFGLNTFALRLPSALFGFLNPFLVFLISMEIFDKIFTQKKASHMNKPFFSFLLSFLFITQSWYFNFARFSFEATFLLFLELMSLYFLIRFIRKINAQDLMGTAIFAGLAYNSYLSGRIFFILPLIYVFYISYKAKQWKNALLFSVVLFVITAPLNLYLLQHGDNRFSEQSFMSNKELSILKKAEFIGENVVSSHLMLFYPGKGDIHGTHNYPYKNALNPIVNVLFFSGILVGLKYFRKNKYVILFFLYYVISILPAIFTYPWENPNMLRMYSALVPIVFFCSLSVYKLTASLSKRINPTFALSFIVILFLLSGTYELRSYYVFHSRVFVQAFEVKNFFLSLQVPYVEKFYLNQ
jgi:hypothetical protein